MTWQVGRYTPQVETAGLSLPSCVDPSPLVDVGDVAVVVHCHCPLHRHRGSSWFVVVVARDVAVRFWSRDLGAHVPYVQIR